MKIKITMPDGVRVRVTLPDGLSDEEIQDEVDGVEAQYLLDTNPDYLSSNAQTEAEANAGVRNRAAIQAQMAGDIATTRMAELEKDGPTLMPYLRQARAEGTDEEQGALRDIMAMPGRGLAAIYDLYENGGFVSPQPKTAEEYFAAGQTGKGILTSPSAIPSALLAAYTGGASLLTQAASQIGANAALLPDYGGEDLALDAVISLLPAGLSLVAGKVKSAGIASLRKALAAKGVHDAPAPVLGKAYDMWSGKEAGRQIRGQAEEGLRGMVDASRAEKSLLAKPKTVDPQVLPKSSLLKNLTPVSPEALHGPVGMDLDLVRRLISESTRGVGTGIKRTEAEAVEALAKVDHLEAVEKTLREKMSTGPYDPEKYKAEIISALGDAADVPEVLEAAKFALTPQARDLRGAGLSMLLEGTPESYHAVLESGRAAQAVPLEEGLAALHAGRELEKGLTKGAGARGWVTEPVVSAAKVASSSRPAVFRAGELLLRGARPGAAAASSVLNRYRDPILYNEDGQQYREIPTEQQLEFSRVLSEYDISEKGKAQKADWEKFKKEVPWKNTILRKLYKN